ncbi:hypothetical protein PHYSODRAFT_299431 [Phytophthora sojae]|uniref:Crinkler effector protein N-terminal domain-containing protein n=1 Tax=Phytophthora sojae (strain P6497) TaxID=1094619 RepID=G4Z8D2_PHYSP|nr:hypothetical protein PHYSODRAFT_299431 [Phytophthora sojae]EGZ21852.1 hypothetical protein PHYSODRAFT_299431 [Phytophthora sojae]|eukprot:XP_009524569.1 hypothetical protein PHYSODRAFT_299431 [Phytophthora sojae]
MVSALVKRRREAWRRRERKLVVERTKRERQRHPNMTIVPVVVVDAARKFHVDIEGDKTIEELKAKLRDPRKGFGCPIDEMNFYLAKRSGKWLQSGVSDFDQLARGEPVPAQGVPTVFHCLSPK